MTDDDIDRDTGEEEERLGGRVRRIDGQTRALTGSTNAFARAITAAFAQGATGAKSFDSVLKSLALRLSSLSVSMALKPAIGALAGGFGKLISGAFGSIGGEANLAAELTKGAVQPMAKGGIIGTPTYFPMGRGGIGLAGEAGPEAIMPLARGPDGRLGVAAAGGAAPNITVNIATADADSFRRSDVYLTGLIARAVARGQRGM
jgi:phage-related minor tail protein